MLDITIGRLFIIIIYLGALLTLAISTYYFYEDYQDVGSDTKYLTEIILMYIAAIVMTTPIWLYWCRNYIIYMFIFVVLYIVYVVLQFNVVTNVPDTGFRRTLIYIPGFTAVLALFHGICSGLESRAQPTSTTY